MNFVDESKGSEGEAPKALLLRAFRAAVAAADPSVLPAHVLPPPPQGRLLVVGAGKAAVAMAGAVEEHYRENFGSAVAIAGLVIAPRSAVETHPSRAAGANAPGESGYGGEREQHAAGAQGLSRIEIAEASHPVPDDAGVKATLRILEAVRGCGPDDHVLVLLSGGGSALLCAPDGIELEQKALLTRELLRSGARIEEINAVRKHLSGVKGGRLAVAATPAPVTTLVLSDVVGDDLSSVASGPTVADPSSYADALEVLDRYGVEAPEARRVLEEGVRGERPETPKPGDARIAHGEVHLVGNNQRSLEAAAETLREGGYPAHILSSSVVGEAREAGGVHAAIVRQILAHGQPFAAPCALVSGGETTVTVRGRGKGGRNSEFALGLVLGLPQSAPVWALCADSDGIDGSEDNAGVYVTPRLLEGLDRRGAARSLAQNDSYETFASAGELLECGPTGTNVNDVRLLLIGRPGES